MSESLGEQEMLWEHKLQSSVSTAFLSELSQIFTSVFIKHLLWAQIKQLDYELKIVW